MDFLISLGITETDLLNIVAIVFVLFLILGLVRAVFRITKSILRMGCAVIFLIAAVLLLMSYLNA